MNSRKGRVKVPDLLWYLSRYLIGPHGVLVGLLAEPEIKSSEDERK